MKNISQREKYRGRNQIVVRERKSVRERILLR